MRYLIDSDWLIDHLEEEPAAMQLLDRLSSDGIAISIITYLEVYQGTLRKSDPAQAQARLDEFASTIHVLPISRDVAKRCAELRETLDRHGRRVRARAFDLLNAATALHHGLTLVTHNVGDYDDVPGLQIYEMNV